MTPVAEQLLGLLYVIQETGGRGLSPHLYKDAASALGCSKLELEDGMRLLRLNGFIQWEAKEK